MNNNLPTLIFRLVVLLMSLAFLVNGGYEYFFMNETADAAFGIAMSALLLNWYMDSTKQDRKI
jgi:hypothetical protein